MDLRCPRDLDHRGNRCFRRPEREGVYFGFQGDLNPVGTENLSSEVFRPDLRLSKRSARGSREPREVPRVKQQPVFERWQCKLACVFRRRHCVVVINSTWLIKGGISEIRGGISEIYHLWLTNQIAELH